MIKSLLVEKKKRIRVWEIDTLRTLCVILMLLDHFLMVFIFLPNTFSNFNTHESFLWGVNDFAIMYWNHPFREGVRFFVSFLFLFLSGISTAFSKNNLTRFLKLAAAASIVAIFTYSAEVLFSLSGVLIVFGILHIMAFSVFVVFATKRIAGSLSWILNLILAILALAGGIHFRFWDVTGLERLPILEQTAALWPFIITAFMFVAAFVIYLFYKKCLTRIERWGIGREGRRKGVGRGVENLFFGKKRFSNFPKKTHGFLPLLAAKNQKFLKGARGKLIPLPLGRGGSGVATDGVGNKKVSPAKNSKSILLPLLLGAIILAAFFVMLVLIPYAPFTGQHRQAFWLLVQGRGYMGADFAGIMPLMGIFLLGAVFGEFFYRKKKSLIPRLDGRWNKAFVFVGKHAIIVYLIHQLLFVLVAFIMFLAAGYVL